jgi:hypothetical protein
MNRNVLLCTLSLLLFPVSAFIILFAVQPAVSPYLLCWGAIGMFVSMLVLARLCADTRLLGCAIVLSIFVRLLFLFNYPPCVDTYRYVWEGLIQQHGFNPFIIPPDSPATGFLRNDIWQKVIFKGTTTIYWPFAQLLFRAAASFDQPLLAVKAIVSCFDLASIVLLILLSRRFGHPLRYVLLYALNPLVLIYTSGQGHIEAIVATMILASIALSEGRKLPGLAYSLLGCAILTKLYAAILLPFFVRRLGLRRLVFLVFPLMLFIPYATDISEYFRIPMAFAGNFSYNGLVCTVLQNGFGLSHQMTLLLAAALLALSLASIFLFTPSLLHAASHAITMMLLCLPVVHPWYFLLLTPYLVFFRQWSWLSLHLTAVPLLFYFNPTISPWIFHDSAFLMTLEYLPFVLLGFCALFTSNRKWPATYSPPEKLSVIVPVLNEENRIGPCLQSLIAQDYPCEIIVVDGGSSDDTLQRASRFPGIVVISSKPGRGRQIAAGVARAAGDILLVLHADGRLKAGSLPRVIDALSARPDAAGGAMAATYDSPSLRFRLVALLNTFRARCLGISFGDQAQFFRRECLPEGFPDFFLMEDVELSLRLKERGALLFLPDGVWSSSRRWETAGYAANFATVIMLTGIYLCLRAFGHIRDKGAWFYRCYYQRAK